MIDEPPSSAPGRSDASPPPGEESVEPLDPDPPSSARRLALATRVESAFESHQLPFFQRLIERASHTYSKAEVEAAAAEIDARMEAIGWRRELRPDAEGRFADHRIFSAPQADASAERLALVGHIDTVFPRSMGFLKFERDGDVARGPGVLDMKSGLCTVIFALEALAAEAPELAASLPVLFILNSEEEVGSPSSRALFAELAPGLRGAMVFEGGRKHDQIITRRKGGGMFTFEFRGRAAHAGNHHAQGINAIHALSLVIPRIEALTDYARGVTVNVGLIEGGTAKNTVPDYAKCVVDTRFERVADADALVRELEAIAADPFAGLEGIPERLREATLTLGGGVTRPPMEASAQSQALRRAYERHAVPAGLQHGEAPLQGGGSDANLLAAHGVPSIDGLGPFGEHFHKVEEWSSLDSQKRRTIALATFLAEYAEAAVGRASSASASWWDVNAGVTATEAER